MSFPSLHDALSTLFHGQRGAPDWALLPGMPGFGDGIDIDDRPGGRAHPPGLQDGDADAPLRPPGMADAGNGHGRHAQAAGGQGHGTHGAADTGPPMHARPAAGEAMRTPSQPLAPPVSPGALDPALQALARELQQLPQSVLRQLGDVLQRNPDALRSLPAQPEALATALSRAVPDAAQVPQGMAGEGRRLAQLAEAAPPAARGQEGDGPREPRHGGRGPSAAAAAASEARVLAAVHDPRTPGPGQAESREARSAGTDGRPAWAAADPFQTSLGRTPPAGEATSPAGHPMRTGAEASEARFATSAPPSTSAGQGSQPHPANPASHAAPAAGAPSAQAPSGPAVQEGLQTLASRAETPGVGVDRGGQAPGFSILGGAVAGVTLAAVATPAGTTHAHAPDAAVRARGERQDILDRTRQRGGQDPGNGDGADGQPAGGRERDRKAAAAAADSSGATRVVPAAAGTGPATGAGVDTPAAARRPGGGRADAAAQACEADPAAAERPGAPGAVASGAAGHTAGGSGAERRPVMDSLATPAAHDPDAARSRWLQALYWSLIVVTYACLGMALATVAPDLTRIPIAAESLDAWRRALTGVGLLAGLWAWLLARRLR